ncbi:MAG: hypothetical protein QE277_06290 [Flectobacillus sp.]|nr:hypothetical protein [Flectobacillus sp.]
MKYIFLLISFLYIHLDSIAQNQSSCSTAQKLMTEATKIENQKNPNYGNAIRKLYSAQIAARDCSPAKETEVKGRIITLFQKIEALRIQAEKDKLQAINNAKRAKIAEDSSKKSAYRALLAQKDAEQKTKEAQIATDNATALYWKSEADKLIPIQGLRLLEKSLPKAKDKKIIKTIKQANATIFNQSNNHQWREKKRFENTVNFDSDAKVFSPDSKWLVITYGDNTAKVWSMEKEIEHYFLKDEKTISNPTFSPDSKWLITKDWNDNSKVWSVETGKYYDFLKDEKTISYTTFSPDSKWLITKDGNDNSKVWSVETGKQYDFLNDEKTISYTTFSPDSKWLITKDGNHNSKVWSVETGKYYDFLKDEKTIRYTTFSPDSKWLITNDVNDNSKVWSIASGKQADFLKDEKNISKVIFSEDCKSLIIITQHQVKTYDTATGKLIQWLWLNKAPTQVNIIDNRYLYVTVGKAIVKTDLQTQQGNLMSFGDGEELDYEYDEIVEWKKALGDQYLLPLDEKIKKKYGIKD